MATLRPAIKNGDGYIEKIIKYIPAEIVAGYTALAGYLSLGSDSPIPPYYKTYYLIIIGMLVIITPVWTYYATIDDIATGEDAEKNKTKAIFHSVIALFALIVWIYAIGNPILKAIMLNCNNTNCADGGLYSPLLGSIILVLFTLLTPLLERIFIGKSS